MATERAPANGYDFPEKEAYRRELWSAVPRALAEAGGHAVILPGREGLEIEHALAAGFAPDRIVCVDESPAVVAHWPWRTEHPCYGSSLGRAAERMAKDGRTVSLLNADLCGCFSRKTRKEIVRAARAMPLADNALVAFTLMKGREDPEDVNLMEMWLEATGGACDPNGPGNRVQAAARLFEVEIGRRFQGTIAHGEYRSGTKNMVWGLYALGFFKEESRIKYVRYAGEGLYDVDEMTDALRTLAIRKGKTPSAKDIVDEWGKDRLTVYRKLFGSLTTAQIISGLVPSGSAWTSRQELIEAEEAYSRLTGEPLVWDQRPPLLPPSGADGRRLRTRTTVFRRWSRYLEARSVQVNAELVRAESVLSTPEADALWRIYEGVQAMRRELCPYRYDDEEWDEWHHDLRRRLVIVARSLKMDRVIEEWRPSGDDFEAVATEAAKHFLYRDSLKTASLAHG